MSVGGWHSTDSILISFRQNGYFESEAAHFQQKLLARLDSWSHILESGWDLGIQAKNEPCLFLAGVSSPSQENLCSKGFQKFWDPQSLSLGARHCSSEWVADAQIAAHAGKQQR